MDDTKIPRPFRIEPLCLLPCSLARTGLVARPCVAFLHSDNHAAGAGAGTTTTAAPMARARRGVEARLLEGRAIESSRGVARSRRRGARRARRAGRAGRTDGSSTSLKQKHGD